MGIEDFFVQGGKLANDDRGAESWVLLEAGVGAGALAHPHRLFGITVFFCAAHTTTFHFRLLLFLFRVVALRRDMPPTETSRPRGKRCSAAPERSRITGGGAAL